MKNILEKNKQNKIELKVEKILAKVRPFIQMHSGDVVLVSIKDDEVVLKVSGSCAHCSLADLTYNKMVGSLIKEEIPSIKNIKLIFKKNGKSKRVCEK